MPHVIVKLWPGKSDDQKRLLADAITRDVTGILGYGDDAVSVGFEEVASADWTEQVFKPDILGKWDQLAKEPGYGPRPGQARS
ncbi:tautomerase family protein [Afifella sp. H1R]|uniref:tautomerase family protein n=1 Tax=Afifella sp. H1R TaxID=2908841 RepID=UPI001F372AFA|nr:tautomerase family protein [Afifella sp. H1R]